MISISRLLCDTISPGDGLRYGEMTPHLAGVDKTARGTPRPVVVWNCTRQCNLSCIHCYANASNQRSAEEMDTASGKAFIRDLAEFGVPVILFSGGEPLLRDDLFEMASLAREQGIRIALSTNGTLITEEIADRIRNVGFAEVGISLDGIEPTNDRFRGNRGAYQAAIKGIRNCVAQGLRVSLRLTITRFNYEEIPAIFQLVEEEGVDRVCFYHLAYSGRGNSLQGEDISHSQTKSVVNIICEHTLDLHRRGLPKEVLTVGNHADGVYLYLKLKGQDAQRATKVLHLLETNGGNNSGIKIGAIDDQGYVHPDQFWWHYSLGNVLQRKFGDIWMDTSEPLLRGLRNRKELLKGRCARCQYLALCNGNLRVRAEAVFGDVWAEDPACYLNDEEIGLT
ncbi:MAG TPA: radical SAM protein [Dehalococcoidia bacterium]|nr:radical SAM protein [Dehalococcoidia bacterium]